MQQIPNQQGHGQGQGNIPPNPYYNKIWNEMIVWLNYFYMIFGGKREMGNSIMGFNIQV